MFFGQTESQNSQSTEERNAPTGAIPSKKKPPVFEKGEQIMFEKSGLSIKDVVEMIVASRVRFSSAH